QGCRLHDATKNNETISLWKVKELQKDQRRLNGLSFRDVSVPAFFGRQDEDGKKWLEMFIRFAACHGWTPAYKLIFVIYYHHNNAAVWFENQNFDSWDAFTREFPAVYGNNFLRARRAEEELRTRAQRSGESCHDYVQIILKLCREYNPLMSESEKIAHILKGIPEHVFYLLFQKDFTYVDEILTFCREMDQKFSRRINNSVLFLRLPNTITFPTYATSHERVEPSLDRSIQQPTASFSAPVSSFTPFTYSSPVVASVTQDEEQITQIVDKVLRTVLPNHPVQTVSAAVTTRTNRDQRQCFSCGRMGHVQRFCRTRQNDRRQESAWRSNNRYSSPRRISNASTGNPNQEVSGYGRVFSNERFRSPSPGPR